jgi:hypothetical protein
MAIETTINCIVVGTASSPLVVRLRDPIIQVQFSSEDLLPPDRLPD